MRGNALAATAGTATEPVTIDNFRRAEIDHYFRTGVAKGCFGELCTERGPAPVDKQEIIRMNCDTPYSAGSRWRSDSGRISKVGVPLTGLSRALGAAWLNWVR